MKKLTLKQAKELFEGLEEARLDFNGWSGNCRILIDFEDMSAWFEIESRQYHAWGETIFTLVAKGDFYNPNERYSSGRLNEIAQEKIKLFEKGYITKLMAD